MQVLTLAEINITEMDGENDGRLMVTARFDPDQPLVVIPGYAYHFQKAAVVTSYGNGKSVEILSPPWMV